jgi:hypothetical protein
MTTTRQPLLLKTDSFPLPASGNYLRPRHFCSRKLENQAKNVCGSFLATRLTGFIIKYDKKHEQSV